MVVKIFLQRVLPQLRSLYAYAFGSYGSTFFPTAFQLIGKHVLISGIVILLTGLNLFNAKVVGELEEWIGGFKLTILILFIPVSYTHLRAHETKANLVCR